MADLLSLARAIPGALLIPPGFTGPQPFDSFEAMVAQVAAWGAEARAQGRALRLAPGRSAYPDFDPFWSVGVYDGAQASANADGRPSEERYLGRLADRWHDAEDMTAAVKALRRAADGPTQATRGRAAA